MIGNDKTNPTNQKIKGLTLFLLVFLIISCKRAKNSAFENKDFPLSELWSYKSTNSILNIATSPDLIIVGSRNNLSALDSMSGNLLWDKFVDSDPDSLPIFFGDNLIVADKSRIITLDNFGNEVNSFEIDTPSQDAELIAVYSGYAFLRRVPAYTLEVYDLYKEAIIWKFAIGRGNLNIGFIDDKEIVIIASSTFVSAHNISSGQILWKLDDTAQTMTLDKTRVYYFPRVLIDNKGANVSAVDAEQGNLIWDANKTAYSGVIPYSMRIFNEILVLGTDHGLIAKNIDDGKEIWHSMTDESVYAQPVLIDGILYARGAYTNSIYAISPSDGRQLGYLTLNQDDVLGLVHDESEHLYTTEEMLIFTTQFSIFVYK